MLMCTHQPDPTDRSVEHALNQTMYEITNSSPENSTAELIRHTMRSVNY